jgi:hypothetical protein
MIDSQKYPILKLSLSSVIKKTAPSLKRFTLVGIFIIPAYKDT